MGKLFDDLEEGMEALRDEREGKIELKTTVVELDEEDVEEYGDEEE